MYSPVDSFQSTSSEYFSARAYFARETLTLTVEFSTLASKRMPRSRSPCPHPLILRSFVTGCAERAVPITHAEPLV